MEDLTIRSSNATGREALLASALNARETERKGIRAQNRIEPTNRNEGQSVLRDSANRENLEEIAENLNRYFSGGRGIRFEVSPDSDDLVVQVVDRESDEVIRSIPAERVLEFSDHFSDIAKGILLDDRA